MRPDPQGIAIHLLSQALSISAGGQAANARVSVRRSKKVGGPRDCVGKLERRRWSGEKGGGSGGMLATLLSQALFCLLERNKFSLSALDLGKSFFEYVLSPGRRFKIIVRIDRLPDDLFC